MNPSTFISPRSYQAPGAVPRRLLGGVIVVVVVVAMAVYWIAGGRRQSPRSAERQQQSIDARAMETQPRGSSNTVDEAAERAVVASRRVAESSSAASSAGAGLPNPPRRASGVPADTLPGLRVLRERPAAFMLDTGSSGGDATAAGPTPDADPGASAREVDARSAESRIFDESALRSRVGDGFSTPLGSDRSGLPGGAAAILSATTLDTLHSPMPAPIDGAAIAPIVGDALRRFSPSPGRDLAQREDEWQERASQLGVAAPPLVARPAAGALVVEEGTVIPAVLTRRIDSDAPGVVTAMVSIDVYDTRTARALLLPKGSRLVGRYNNDVAAGQERLQIAFTRLILPDGSSFDLPAAIGSDALGQAGLPADVDRHFLQRFGAALLIGVIADHVVSPQAVPQTNAYGGGLSATGQVLVNTADAELHRSESVAPTLTVPEGARLNVEVVRDMVFSQPFSAHS